MFKFSALLNEIRKCRSFIVLSEFMRHNLLMNGFAEEAIYLDLGVFDDEHCGDFAANATLGTAATGTIVGGSETAGVKALTDDGVF